MYAIVLQNWRQNLILEYYIVYIGLDLLSLRAYLSFSRMQFYGLLRRIKCIQDTVGISYGVDDILERNFVKSHSQYTNPRSSTLDAMYPILP